MMQVEGSIKVDTDDLVPKGAIGLQKSDRDVPVGNIGKQFNRSRSGFELIRSSSNRIPIGDIDLKGEDAAWFAGAEDERSPRHPLDSGRTHRRSRLRRPVEASSRARSHSARRSE